MPPVTTAAAVASPNHNHSKDMKRSISHHQQSSNNNSSKTPPELILEVRKQVLETASLSSHEYDRTDLDRILKTDEMIQRWIVEHYEDNDVDPGNTASIIPKVCNKLTDTLKWRHEFGVNNLKDSDFPREFYECGFLSYGAVAAGHQVIVMRIDRLIRLKHWSDLWIKFIVHEMEKISSAEFAKPGFLDREKCHVISDASQAGFAQINLHFLMTIIPIFFHHYPQAVAKVWLFEVPYLCMALKPIIMKSLPGYIAKKIVFTDRKNISDIGHDSLPAEYGGRNDNRLPLAQCNSMQPRSLQEIGKEYNIPDHEISKMSGELAQLIRKTKQQQQQ